MQTYILFDIRIVFITNPRPSALRFRQVVLREGGGPPILKSNRRYLRGVWFPVPAAADQQSVVPPHRCTAAAPDPTEETSSRNSPQLTQFTQKSGLLWTQFSRHNKHESSHRHLPSTLLFEIYGSEDFIWLLCALSFSQVSRHGLHHFTDDYSHLSSGTARQSQQVEERHQVY